MLSSEALNLGEVTAFLSILLDSTLSANVTAYRRKFLKFISCLYIYTYSVPVSRKSMHTIIQH
jgi:hypothetical protein